MNRALALTVPLTAANRFAAVEIARQMIVLGCAAALIFAGQALPF